MYDRKCLPKACYVPDTVSLRHGHEENKAPALMELNFTEDEVEMWVMKWTQTIFK